MDKTSKLNLNMPNDNDLVTPEDFNVNAAALEAYVTTLTQVCSAYAPSALALAPAWKTVPFGSIVKSGYAFGLSGGGVKLSEGGFVIVDAHLLITGLAAGDGCGVHIAKNGSTFGQYTYTDTGDGGWITVDQTSRLVPVAKNDVITIKVATQSRSQGTIDQEVSWVNVHLYKDLNF
jgi:hypothetical protein